jgi:Lar family restriction alleviation protein
MTTHKLLPCPHCGDDEISHGFNDPPPSPDLYGIVQCHTCDAFMLGEDESGAIAAWNTRHPIERPTDGPCPLCGEVEAINNCATECPERQAAPEPKIGGGI